MPSKRESRKQSTESLVHTHTQADTLTGEPVMAPDQTPSPRRRSSRRMSSAAAKDPFFNAASCPEGTSPAMYFQAKYYGPCPDIPTASDAPAEVNIIELLQAKKNDGDQLKCNMYFSDKGIAVLSRESTAVPLAVWKTHDVASCATIKHPHKKGRRVGMLKVRDPETRKLTWHLFKYCSGKTDNMSDCFRYVVDCSLRDIGRAVTARAQRELEQQLDAAAGSRPPLTAAAALRPAWPEPAPPRYQRTEPAKRQLDFGVVACDADADADSDDDATKEARDIASSEKRQSVDTFVYRAKQIDRARQTRESRPKARVSETGHYIDVHPIAEADEEAM